MKQHLRLSDPERFRQVRHEGKSYSNSLVALHILPNQLEHSRSGFTASKRLGKAVERNRARRRIRETVRLLWPDVAPGWDLVWVARRDLRCAPFLDLQEACVRLLLRAGLLAAGAAVSGSGMDGTR